MADTFIDPTCDFCVEFNGLRGDLFDKLTGENALSRVVLKAGKLNAIPSLGEILPYHLLIVPAYHVMSILNLEPADKVHFAELIRHIRKVYEKAFGQTPVFFEHGDPTGKDVFGGQCIAHAHFHVLPKNVDLLSNVCGERALIASIPLDDLTADIAQSYVAVMADDEVLHLFSSADAPRQYLRALYGKLAGVEGAENWYTRRDGKITASSTDKIRRLFDDDHG